MHQSTLLIHCANTHTNTHTHTRAHKPPFLFFCYVFVFLFCQIKRHEIAPECVQHSHNRDTSITAWCSRRSCLYDVCTATRWGFQTPRCRCSNRATVPTDVPVYNSGVASSVTTTAQGLCAICTAHAKESASALCLLTVSNQMHSSGQSRNFASVPEG